MFTLIEIEESDREKYMERTIRHYAQELLDTGLWTSDQSHKKSTFETKNYISNNPDGYWLLIHCDEIEKSIGFLWLTLEEQYQSKYAYISDFEIWAEHQGKGYAKNAFIALESFVFNLGVTDIRLHVFEHNARAQSLYNDVGFGITGIHMHKKIIRDKK